ncbi:MAG TPA: hypothetical protein VII22_07245 [Streptosporangiaceae bacterium]
MTGITLSIWHNVARDQAGRHTAPLDGFTPGDPMVRVFTYQTLPRARSAEAIAEDAFALANGHPRDPEGMELSRRYYERRLRSLSFPGKLACCGRSCCSSMTRRTRRVQAGSRRARARPQRPDH